MKDGRRKGNKAELDAAAMLCRVMGFPKGTIRRRGTQDLRDWVSVGDLSVAPDYAPVFPYSVEVKCIEGWSLDSLLAGKHLKMFRSWLTQCDRQAGAGNLHSMLLATRNRADWLCVTPANHPAHVRFEEASTATILCPQLFGDLTVLVIPRKVT